MGQFQMAAMLVVLALGASCSKNKGGQRSETEVFEPSSYGTAESQETAGETNAPERSDAEPTPPPEQPAESEPQLFWGLEDRPTGEWPGDPPFALSGGEKGIHIYAPMKSENDPRRRIRLAWLEDMSRTKHLEIKFPEAPEFNRVFDITDVEGYWGRYHQPWGPESALTFSARAFGVRAGEKSDLYPFLTGEVRFEFRWFEPDTGCSFSFSTVLNFAESPNQPFGVPPDAVEDWGDSCSE